MKTENSVSHTVFGMYLDGTTIVFWMNTIYIMMEQKSKRIVCEDQSQRRLKIFHSQCYILYLWYMLHVVIYMKGS